MMYAVKEGGQLIAVNSCPDGSDLSALASDGQEVFEIDASKIRREWVDGAMSIFLIEEGN